MRKDVYDYAIVGGGCSGLSLAVELTNALPDNSRIAIIEQRKAYSMDRIWCFWNTKPHRFSQAVQHEWRRWRVCNAGREVDHTSDRYPYQYLPADAFYDLALDVINRFGSAELLLETRAVDMVAKDDVVYIYTESGHLKAHRVFDGRNNSVDHIGQNLLLQHYLGQCIRTTSPVFDPDTLILMDFDVSQLNGITFVYLLPFSQTEALVEPTIFSRSPLEPEAYTTIIRNYLMERFQIDEYEVLFEEQGVIPMSADLASPTKLGRITPIGTAAGTIKGSTGYGFLAIQQWNRGIVETLFGNLNNSLPRPRSQLASLLDRVFLSFLDTYPARAPDVFFNLFRRVPADRLIRFLSDQASLLDIAAVVMSMPKAAFSKQAVQLIADK
jgi:lycopene beta-cyclase